MKLSAQSFAHHLIRPLRRQFPILALLAGVTAPNAFAVAISYDVHQDFVDGSGDYQEYLDDGDFNLEVVGSFAFVVPSSSDFSGESAWTHRANSILAPLTLAFGGASFDFSGPVDFFVDLINQHIQISFQGDEAYTVFSFFGPSSSYLGPDSGGVGPEFDPDPAANLLHLSEWGGYLDFYHHNGSHLYSDIGGNVSVGPTPRYPVFDEGSTAGFLCLALIGIIAAVRRFRT